MFPTIDNFGDILLVQKFGLHEDALEVGDVVMAKSPVDPGYSICKRIVMKVCRVHAVRESNEKIFL